MYTYKPRVVAIVPTYNHDKWLWEALESLVNQTVKPQIIVVVDDGSTDNTWPTLLSPLSNIRNVQLDNTNEPAELKTAGYKDIAFVLVRFSKNYGPSVARNYAIRSIQENNEEGIVAFLDSDDVYEPTKIEEGLKYFGENPFIGLVYSDYTTFNDEGEQHQWKWPYTQEKLYQEALPNMDSLFRIKCFIDCGYFDESLRTVEDWSKYLDISKKFCIAHCPKSLVRIRIGKHSSTDTVSKEVWQQNYQKVFKKHMQGNV